MNTATRRRSRLAALAAAPLLLIALAACSPQSSGGSGSTDTPAQGSTQWRLDFAKCMRGEGIDVPDPGANGAVPASGPEDETPERQTATKKCLAELGPQPVQNGGDGDQQIGQDQLQIAQCLREHGFDVADPAAGGSLVLPENLTDDVAEACGVNSMGPVPPQ